MRACQPLPSCLNASSTSVSSRSVWLTFLSLRRPATAAAHQLLSRLFPDKFRKRFRRWPRPGEVVLRPLGIVVVRARGRSFAFFAIQSYLSSVCPAEADNSQILAARRHHRRMQAAVEECHHQQPRLAVIAAGILHDQRENSSAWRCQGPGDLVRVYPNKAIDETSETVLIGLKSGL